jgi:hypothetical protein
MLPSDGFGYVNENAGPKAGLLFYFFMAARTASVATAPTIAPVTTGEPGLAQVVVQDAGANINWWK